MKVSFSFFCVLFLLFWTAKSMGQIAHDSIRYYYDVANYSTDSKELLNAFTFYENLKNKTLEEKDYPNTISHLRQLAIIQYKLDLFNESEQSAVEALQLLETRTKNDSNKIDNETGIHIQLGRIYQKKEDYEEALRYFNLVLNSTVRERGINTTNTNLANIYYNLKQYDSATSIYRRVLDFNQKRNDTLKIARALTYLGMAEGKLQKPGALEKIKNALELREKKQYELGVFDSYYNLSEYYKDRKNLDSAKTYLEKALAIAHKTQDIGLKKEALSKLIDLNEDSHIKAYKQLTDSITKANQQKKNQYFARKYNVSVKEKEALKYRQERTLLFFIGVLVLMISIFIYFIIRTRHKKEKLKKVYETETRISKRIHDEVANDIYLAMNKLQMDSNNTEAVLDDLETIYNRTRDISKANQAITTEENFAETPILFVSELPR